MEDLDFVLVLGSKPDSKLPDIQVKKIYTANAAAERVLEYKKKYNNFEHIALAGINEFNKNLDVKKRIINSKPNRLVFRSKNKSNDNKFEFPTKIDFLDTKEQFNFQSNFFKFGKLDTFIGEIFFYKSNLYQKFKKIYNLLNGKYFFGCSTGFFSILFAIYENPNSKIITSGIGLMEKLGYFYSNGEIQRKHIRLGVDKYLINRLNNTFKDQILTLDTELHKFGLIKNWKKKVF